MNEYFNNNLIKINLKSIKINKINLKILFIYYNLRNYIKKYNE